MPRPQQQEIHDLCWKKRFGVVVAHRRFGKSVLFANHLQRSAISTDKPNWRGGFIGPTYTQAKAILWDHLRNYSKVVDGVKYNESELRVDYTNGARVRIFGGDNPDSLRGLYFDELVIDEADLVREMLWSEVLRPAVADRKGNAYFIGTFKHTNGPLGKWYDEAKEDPDWFAQLYRASDTGILDDEELRGMKRAMSAEEYARELECVRSAAVKGSVFGRLVDQADSEGRILESKMYDPALQVTTAWDLGIGDSTAIWFVQQIGSEVHLIDYYESSGESLAHYAKVLQDKEYVYREHLAPHDIGVRELGTGKSRLEVAAGLGIHFRVLPRVSQTARSEVDERIEAGRMLLPRCYFQRMNCKQGLDALRSWHRDENKQTGELRNVPVHDWSSHGADAFTHLAMGLRRPGKVSRPKVDTRWVT